MQARISVTKLIKENKEVSSINIRTHLLVDAIHIEQLDKWKKTNKNYNEKLQRLISSETSQDDLTKILQEMDPSFVDAQLVERIYLRNQSYALVGDYTLVQKLRNWLSNHEHVATILENIKCHSALKILLQDPNLTPQQLADYDNELYSDFVAGKTRDEINTKNPAVVNDLVLDESDNEGDDQQLLFKDDNDFAAAKHAALYRGIWGNNQETATLKLSATKKQLAKLETLFPTDGISRFFPFLPLEKKFRLGAIIGSKQYDRYKNIIRQMGRIKGMNLEEAHIYCRSVSIHGLIQDIDSMQDEITKALEVCTLRQTAIDKMLLEFQGRDLSEIKNKAQRQQVSNCQETLKGLEQVNKQQTDQLKNCKMLFDGSPAASSVKQILQQVLQIADAKKDKRFSVQLNLHSHIVKVETYHKDANQTEQEYEDDILGKISNIVQHPLQYAEKPTELKVNDAAEKSAIKYVEQPEAGTTTAYFCESTHKVMEQGVEKEVKGVAVFTERERYDGSRVYKHVSCDEKNLPAKVSMIFDACFKARCSAWLSTGPGNAKVELHERQPYRPLVLTTDSLQTAALYYLILTEAYGLKDHSFFCNFSVDTIKKFCDQNQTALVKVISDAGLAEKAAAWKSYANRDERVTMVKNSSTLFSKTAHQAREEKDEVQKNYDHYSKLSLP